MDHVEYTYTVGMDEEEVASRLREAPNGTLSLARDGEAYAIPATHYYDGEALYFRLGEHEGSEKMAFLETTTRACFVCYGTASPDESWSVVVRGPVSPVTDEERFDDATINEVFPNALRVFGESVPELDAAIYRMEMEAVTGRRTVAGDEVE